MAWMPAGNAPGHGEIRLVALSAYSGQQIKAKTAEPGFDLCLVKPMDFGKLQRFAAQPCLPGGHPRDHCKRAGRYLFNLVFTGTSYT
jgi:hypothetical protein